MVTLVAAPASAKHQFLSDIQDSYNYTPHSSLRIVGGQVGLSSYPDIGTLRRIANGTSNMVSAFDKAVTAVAPARVRVPRLTNPPWIAIEDLP